VPSRRDRAERVGRRIIGASFLILAVYVAVDALWTLIRRDSPQLSVVGIAITADGKTAFVALGPANRVAMVDTKTYEVRKYLLVGQRVWNLAFSLDGKRLYTTNGVSNDLSVIDVDALRVTKSIPVGGLPWGVVVTP